MHFRSFLVKKIWKRKIYILCCGVFPKDRAAEKRGHIFFINPFFYGNPKDVEARTIVKVKVWVQTSTNSLNAHASCFSFSLVNRIVRLSQIYCLSQDDIRNVNWAVAAQLTFLIKC